MFTNVITDLSHWNQVNFDTLVKESDIRGIIHKATEGTSFIDPQYKTRESLAVENSLLWGAYHFGCGGNATQQAQRFLDTINNPTHPTLLALDLEDSHKGDIYTMTQREAEEFVQYIKEKTNLYPTIYGSLNFLDHCITSHPTILTECPLWLALWRDYATLTLPKGWDRWTLWQYTDGKKGTEPHEVAGVGHCDRDKFNGTLAELETFWSSFLLKRT